MSYTQDEILAEILMSNYTHDDGDYMRMLDISKHKNSKKFMLKVVEQELNADWGPRSLLYTSQKLKNDVDFLLQVAQLVYSNPGTRDTNDLLYWAQPTEDTINKITNSKKTLIQFLELGVDGSYHGKKHTFIPFLDKAPQEFRDDKDVVMALVKSNKRTLKYASERLKSDIDVVKQAIKTDYRSIKYARIVGFQDNIELNYLAFKDNIEDFHLADLDIQSEALECLYQKYKKRSNENEKKQKEKTKKVLKDLKE